MNRRSFLSSAGTLLAASQVSPYARAAGTTPTAPSPDTILPGNVAAKAAARLSRLSNLERFRQHVLALSLTTLNTGWEDVLVPQGMAWCGLAGDDALGKLAERWSTPHLQLRGPGEVGDVATKAISAAKSYRGVRLGTYCGDWGMPLVLAPLYQLKPREELREFAGKICDHIIDGSLRLADGGIAHGPQSPATRERLWVDTLYYTASPLAGTFAITGKAAYAEEAIRQCLVHAKYLQDPATGLFFHDAEPATGRRSDFFWARGNGWVIMSLLDTLTQIPASTPGWPAVLDSYRRLVTGVLRLQHPSGLWRIVPEDPESHLEVSGTTMILIGILGGIEAELLQPESVGRVTRGFGELCTWIGRDGGLQGAQRPAGVGGWATHKQSALGECTYATGVFLRLMSMVATSKRMTG